MNHKLTENKSGLLIITSKPLAMPQRQRGSLGMQKVPVKTPLDG